MDATNKQGHIWNGERNGDYWLYLDSQGKLYESTEVPVYRIVMDKATLATVNGVTAILPASAELEWKLLPRGTHRAELNPLEIDVWRIAGLGWRFNIFNAQTGCYVATGVAKTEEDCKQVAAINARNYLHPPGQTD